MTRTVERKAITASMKLLALKPYTVVHCAECWGENNVVDIQFDHHLALVDGGAHDVENIRPLCIGCHRKKSAREHKENCKTKRLIDAREAQERGEKKASRMKSRGFDRTRTKKFNRRVAPRTPATAEI